MDDNTDGWLLSGATVLLAYLDGMLFPLLGAVGLGVYGKLRTQALLSRSSTTVIETRRKQLDAWIREVPDARQRETRRAGAERCIAALTRQAELDRWGAEEAAKWVGLGVFAAPIAGLVVAGIDIKKLMTELNIQDTMERVPA